MINDDKNEYDNEKEKETKKEKERKREKKFKKYCALAFACFCWISPRNLSIDRSCSGVEKRFATLTRE